MQVYKPLTLLFLLMIVMTNCVKEEGKLKPSEEPEKIYGDDFTLPQGNHDYDQYIVDFYQEYGTVFLYKVVDHDIYWIKASSNAAIYDEESNTTTKGFHYKPADEDYVDFQLKLIKDYFLFFFKDEFIKRNLPLKIFLVSEYFETTAGQGTIDERKNKIFDVFDGLDFFGVTWGNDKIVSLTDKKKKEIGGRLSYFLINRATNSNRVLRSQLFFDQTNYSMSMSTPELRYQNGIIDNDRKTANADWEAYLEMILSTPYTDLISPGGFLHPDIDTKGVIFRKYEIMLNHFLENYDIDLYAIINN